MGQPSSTAASMHNCPGALKSVCLKLAIIVILTVLQCRALKSKLTKYKSPLYPETHQRTLFPDFRGALKIKGEGNIYAAQTLIEE